MKNVSWGVIHGEGTIIAKCDQCGKREEYDFEEGLPDFKAFQKELFGKGWKSAQIFGEWHDFCCEKYRNKYIKNHTIGSRILR